MDENQIKTKSRFIAYRKVLVILSYASLLGFILSFEYCKYYSLTVQSESICAVFGLIFLVSFFFGFIRTGLWNFIHKPLRQLDEREMEQTGKALRISYSVFSIFILSLLLIFSLTDYSIDVVTVLGFLIIAHSLPAAVIAWIRKGI